MQKFRKKPVEIEAIQWDGENVDEIKGFVGEKGFYYVINDRSLVIPTLKGDHKAMVGDWVTKDDAGEFYPCKPDTFEATYESV